MPLGFGRIARLAAALLHGSSKCFECSSTLWDKRLSHRGNVRPFSWKNTMDFPGITLYDALVGANVPPDKAKAVVHAMEKEMTDTLATKQDLQMLRQDMQALELRLINTMTLRFGAMLVAGTRPCCLVCSKALSLNLPP